MPFVILGRTCASFRSVSRESPRSGGPGSSARRIACPACRTASAMASAAATFSRASRTARAGRRGRTDLVARSRSDAPPVAGRRAGFHRDQAGRMGVRKPLELRAREFPVGRCPRRSRRPRGPESRASRDRSPGCRRRSEIGTPYRFLPLSFATSAKAAPDVAVPGKWARMPAR